jgi:prepilin-type N-terminal cleavage/methylation domain
MKKNGQNKGFSLIELIIVITIMAVLTALIAPQLLRYVEQARVAKDAAAIEEMEKAIELAMVDETVFSSIINGSSRVASIRYFANGKIEINANTAQYLATDIHATLGGTLSRVSNFLFEINGLPPLSSNA